MQKSDVSKFAGQNVQSELSLRKTPKEKFQEGNQLLKEAIEYVLRRSAYQMKRLQNNQTGSLNKEDKR